MIEFFAVNSQIITTTTFKIFKTLNVVVVATHRLQIGANKKINFPSYNKKHRQLGKFKISTKCLNVSRIGNVCVLLDDQVFYVQPRGHHV